MPVGAFSRLACPLDGAPLVQAGGAQSGNVPSGSAPNGPWRCPDGHSFDVARQGYVNLLPVQQKRSRDPGDSREMVEARRRFLESGHYRPLAAAVARTALDGLAGRASLLDAGCGEGHYLRELAAAVPESLDLDVLGLDISKWAVAAAARQDKRPRWVVGSNARLPVESASLDRVLCLFGFPVYAEFARVLKPDGRLLMVDPGPDHLRELREILYPELKSPKPEAETPEGFARAGDETVRYPLHLSGAEAVADLLAMTPHLHRASAEGRARAAALTGLDLTVEVKVVTYTRAG